MPRKFKSLLLVFALVLSLTPRLSAQSTGQIAGQVLDSSNLAIPEAKVGLRLPGGEKAIFEAVTGSDGNFNITSVRPDVYDLVIEKQGFENQVLRNVRVEASRNTNLP